jgi:hypothetical protein
VVIPPIRCAGAGGAPFGRVRGGISLVEILVALVILSVAGIVMLSALQTGARGAARAGEHQLVALLGARVVDRIVAGGFGGLAPAAGQTGDLDLSRWDTSASGASGAAATAGTATVAAMRVPGGIELDGITVGGRYQVELLADGLLRLSVTLTWRKPGESGPGSVAALRLTRLVADPTLGARLRPGGNVSGPATASASAADSPGVAGSAGAGA